MNPLVSIIIPVYNAETYLEKTISSALNQNWNDIEIIIIDDGSTDDSVNIAERFGNNKISIYKQQNKGASAARNIGLSVSKGTYIQFLDADDLIGQNKISTQVKLLQQNPNKLAVCSTIHFYNDADLMNAKPSAYEDSFLFNTDNPADFLVNLYGGTKNQGSMVQTGAWLTPTTLIKKAGNWSDFYSPDDDGDYFCRVVLASQGIVYTDNCYNYYRKYNSDHNWAAAKTKKALNGKFESFLLKKHHLLSATNNPIAKKALAFSAMDLAITAYVVDKNLTDKILKTIEELGGINTVPVLGGKNIELIKKVFGWKTALNFKYYYNKFTGS